MSIGKGSQKYSHFSRTSPYFLAPIHRLENRCSILKFAHFQKNKARGKPGSRLEHVYLLCPTTLCIIDYCIESIPSCCKGQGIKICQEVQKRQGNSSAEACKS